MSLKTKVVALIALNPPLAIAVMAGMLCLIAISAIWIWSMWHSDSPNEQKADDARVETIATEADLTVATQNVETAIEADKSASRKATEARKPLEQAKKRVTAAKQVANKAVEPVSNVSYAEANRVRCAAYPQDAGCQ
jgi:hypothetical protein